MQTFIIVAALGFAFPLPSQGQPPASISGTVVDSVSGTPIAGATVRLVTPGQMPSSAVTGPDGRFHLALGSAVIYATGQQGRVVGMSAAPATLSVTRAGYAPVTQPIVRDAPLTIRLSLLGTEGTRVATAQSLERLTITAVRATDAAPVASTTLDERRLERDYTGQDVPLTLRQAPSVTAYSESGSLLNYSYFRIRGIDQSRVNITLDGIPLNEPEDQQIYFSDFPDLTSSIQSMQVQRGVGTSTYGQAAFGGSVNFATHSLPGAERSTVLEAGGGSFGTARTTLRLNSGALDDRLALHARLSGMRSDGYRDGATSAANSAFVSAGYFGDRDLVKFTATSGLERNGQTYAAVPLDELRTNPRANPLAGVGDKYRESFATLSYTRLVSTDVSAGLTAYGFTTRGFYDYPSGAPGPALRFRSASRWGGLIAAAHIVKGRLTLDGGAHGMTYSKDHEFDDRPDLQYPGYSNTGYKTEASAFTKAAIALGAATLFGDLQVRTAEFRYRPTAGYGLDDVSQRWNFVNPKVGVTLQATPAVSLFASWGTTGREPTRGDLFAGADDVTPDDAPALLPLTRVRPEHVNDLEAGVTALLGRAHVTLTAFDMRFRDEIARTGATTPLGYDIRGNVGRSYRRGLELDAAFAISPAVDLRSSLTVSRNRIEEYRDEGTGVTYRDVEPVLTPAFLAYQQLTWRTTRTLTLTADSRYQGLSYLAPRGDTRLTSPAFHVLDAGARYELGSVTLAAYGRNLLNRRAYPAGDVSGDGTPRFFILAPTSLDVSVTLRR
ncbi:MAG TPA: TonB-dependent receptor [Gemmatimonadaceae bacterium]